MISTKSTLKSMSALVVLAAALAPCAAVASTLNVTSATHAFFGKNKVVKFSLRNQTGAPIELKAGDQTVTLESGKTTQFKLAPGTQVVTTTASGKREAGTIICQATPDMNDTTVVLN
jgi:hypothetical protein